jgi:hypothetical protein
MFLKLRVQLPRLKAAIRGQNGPDLLRQGGLSGALQAPSKSGERGPVRHQAQSPPRRGAGQASIWIS